MLFSLPTPTPVQKMLLLGSLQGNSISQCPHSTSVHTCPWLPTSNTCHSLPGVHPGHRTEEWARGPGESKPLDSPQPMIDGSWWRNALIFAAGQPGIGSWICHFLLCDLGQALRRVIASVSLSHRVVGTAPTSEGALLPRDISEQGRHSSAWLTPPSPQAEPSQGAVGSRVDC